jgi:hypothetical protein
MFDFFKRSKKDQKRETLRQNRVNGQSAEDMYRAEADLYGVDYTRTGRGHDFEEKRYDWKSGKTHKVKVEVKSNDAPLSKLLKKTRKKNPKNYEVRRYNTSFFGFGGIVPPKKKKKSKKTDYDPEDMFGTNNGGWF